MVRSVPVPEQREQPAEGDEPAGTDWSFARRPFWLFSHLFAATVIVSFVLLGLWQFDRHGERSEENDVVGERAEGPASPIEGVVDGDPADLAYRLVTVGGTFVDGDALRVANRSQDGVAGQHVVGLFRLDDGRLLVVNRGFVPVNTTVELRPAPSGPVVIEGWLQPSVGRERFGATDTGEGTVLPRLDLDAVETRVGEPVLDVWLQLGASENGELVTSFPDPVPLPPLDGGPHFSYAVQWFIFAVLGVAFYGALLRRSARGRHRAAPTVS